MGFLLYPESEQPVQQHQKILSFTEYVMI